MHDKGKDPGAAPAFIAAYERHDPSIRTGPCPPSVTRGSARRHVLDAPASAGPVRAKRALPVRSRSRNGPLPRRAQCQETAAQTSNRPNEGPPAPSEVDTVVKRFAANLRCIEVDRA